MAQTPARPDNVEQKEWDSFTPEQQVWVAKHERMHRIFRERFKNRPYPALWTRDDEAELQRRIKESDQ